MSFEEKFFELLGKALASKLTSTVDAGRLPRVIKTLLIVVASIVGFAALFYVVLRLASRTMRKTATVFVIAVMEQRYRHARDMLDSDLRA